MRTLFLDYIAQSLVLGLAVAALLAATPLLQKRLRSLPVYRFGPEPGRGALLLPFFLYP